MTERFACIHSKTCGGCPLIERSYTDQLTQKLTRVRESLSGFPALTSLRATSVLEAEPRSAYRTRAKLMVVPGGRVGLFGVSGDHEVVDTPGCIVLAPVLTRVLDVLREMIAAADRAGEQAPLAPRTAPSAGGLLAIDLREVVPPAFQGAAIPRVLVTWVIVRSASLRLEKLRAAAEELRAAAPEVLGVAVNFHEGEGPQVLGDETHLLAGQGWGLDTIGGTSHRATFGSFVQAHRGQAARVHERIAAAIFGGQGEPLKKAPRVLDLYGGSGAIALSLAARGADVLMVESFAPAVQQAQESARLAGLSLTAERADVADALVKLARRSGHFDAAVVNPPRRGLDPLVRARLAALALPTVVYVSCQPETLARDLDHFARLGLSAVELQPLDMIPLTEEVETIAVLHPAPPSPPRILYEDDEVLIVDKSPHEPTTPQGEYRGSLLDRVQKLVGAKAAVPVHRLDVGTSGVVIFAKDPSYAEAWSNALLADGATKTYVTAVRGVTGGRGDIQKPLTIDGKIKQARTRFERESAIGNHSLLRVVPEEGRTHQIRRHLAGIGHPVLGDERYGHAATNRFFIEKHGLDRTFLHARRLELRHPRTGKTLVVEAPLPGDLVSVVRSVALTRSAPLRTAQ